MSMYKQFDSAAARKCPVVIYQNTQATHKKKRAKKPDGVHFFSFGPSSLAHVTRSGLRTTTENFVLFGFQQDFLILFFLFYTKSKPAEDKSTLRC